MDELKRLLLLAALLAHSAAAAPPVSLPATPTATHGATSRAPSPKSTSATAWLTGTVPLTAVPWGPALAEYIRVLRDPRSKPAELEAARHAVDTMISAPPKR